MSSDISSGVSAAVSAASNSGGSDASTLVLGSVLRMQANNAEQLVQSAAQAVPPPALASSGSVGTRVNTYA